MEESERAVFRCEEKRDQKSQRAEAKETEQESGKDDNKGCRRKEGWKSVHQMVLHQGRGAATRPNAMASDNGIPFFRPSLIRLGGP